MERTQDNSPLETLINDVSVEIKNNFLNQDFHHRHNGYELYFLQEGKINFYTGKELHAAEAGSLFLIRPDEYHRIQSLSSSTPYRRILVYFLPRYLQKLSSDFTDLTLCFDRRPTDHIRMIHMSDVDQKQYVALATRLSRYLGSRNYGDDLRANMLATELMLFVNHLFQADIPETKNIMPRIVIDTMAYVEEKLTEDFTIDQLAKDLYHNRSYISRVFRESTGTTLQQYIITQRIHAAKRLLESGESISESCYKSGFRNYSNFIRTFTKNVGTSPLHYQRESAKAAKKEV